MEKIDKTVFLKRVIKLVSGTSTGQSALNDFLAPALVSLGSSWIKITMGLFVANIFGSSATARNRLNKIQNSEYS